MHRMKDKNSEKKQNIVKHLTLKNVKTEITGQ